MRLVKRARDYIEPVQPNWCRGHHIWSVVLIGAGSRERNQSLITLIAPIDWSITDQLSLDRPIQMVTSDGYLVNRPLISRDIAIYGD